MRRLALLMFLAFAPAQAVAAPSFSCAAARSWDERLICRNDALAELDRDLDALYRKTRAELGAQGADLGRAQAAWRDARARRCGANAQISAVQTSPAGPECLVRLYRLRIASLVKLRAEPPPTVSLQHLLNRAANDPRHGERLLLENGTPPAVALAAWLGFLRGDQAVALARMAEAEARIAEDWNLDWEDDAKGIWRGSQALTDWASEPGIAAGPALLRRIVGAFRRHDIVRRVEAADRWALKDILDSKAPWTLERRSSGDDPDPEAYALRLPCTMLQARPLDALDALVASTPDDVAEIVANAFDCASARHVATKSGRELNAALKALENAGRDCGGGYVWFQAKPRPAFLQVADMAPRALLDRKMLARAEASPEHIFPRPWAPSNEAKIAALDRNWGPSLRALTAGYVADGLASDQALFLAKAVLAEFAGPICLPPVPRRAVAASAATPKAESPTLEERGAEVLSEADDAPDRAARALRAIDHPSAKAALAVVLHVYRTGASPPTAAIDRLVRTLERDDGKTASYDGSLASLIEAVAEHFPERIPCAMLLREPKLLLLSDPRYGGTRDAFLPFPDCDLRSAFPVPPSVARYATAAEAPANDFLGTHGGTLRHFWGRQQSILELQMHMFPRAFLSDENDKVDARKGIAADFVPFESWSLLSLANRRVFGGFASIYRQAHADLGAHYVRNFGLSAEEAAKAARRALGAFAYEGVWDAPGEAGLRSAIFNGAPLSKIADLIKDIADIAAQPESELEPSKYAFQYSGPPDSYLHIAVARPDILRLLLAKSGDAGAVNYFQKSVLMVAAQENQPQSTVLLLAAGAPVHATTNAPDESVAKLDFDRRTALHYAAASGGLETIRLLLAAGADPLQPDNKGLRPIHYLVGEGPVAANRVLSDRDFKEAARLLR